jgi:IS5 family transposase
MSGLSLKRLDALLEPLAAGGGKRRATNSDHPEKEIVAQRITADIVARQSKRELFLDQMNHVVPWAELLALVEPFYPKAGNGRQPVGLAIMLRTYFLQQWFSLSDPGMEEAFYESPVLRRFAGVDLAVAAAPDETTILRFRHLLEQHDLGGEMLDTVNHYLESKGIRISTGTIVDATIIHAPSSTKNSTGERDPEMHQTKKGPPRRMVLRSQGTHRRGQPGDDRAFGVYFGGQRGG